MGLWDQIGIHLEPSNDGDVDNDYKYENDYYDEYYEVSSTSTFKPSAIQLYSTTTTNTTVISYEVWIIILSVLCGFFSITFLWICFRKKCPCLNRHQSVVPSVPSNSGIPSNSGTSHGSLGSDTIISMTQVSSNVLNRKSQCKGTFMFDFLIIIFISFLELFSIA